MSSVTQRLTERINAGEFRGNVLYPLGKKGSEDLEGRAAWKAEGQRIDALFRAACEEEFGVLGILPKHVLDMLYSEAKRDDGVGHHDIAGYYESLADLAIASFYAGARSNAMSVR